MVPVNISVELAACVKLSRNKDFNAVQFLNMVPMLVTELVSKVLKSSFSSFSLSENMAAILVTELVSKLLTSNASRLVQPANMARISVTKLVLKLLTSNFSRALQFLNI
ncbi:Uncharacterised protein [Listeria monocytogenes]|nr:Uncharacterised protein [Listeria monocytogenes]CWW46527.1 Uncharacterised protein [Listeria monocytogenes]